MLNVQDLFSRKSYAKESYQLRQYFSNQITLTSKTKSGSTTTMFGLRESLWLNPRVRFIEAREVIAYLEGVEFDAEEHEKFSLAWATADEILQNWESRNENKDYDHWIYFMNKSIARAKELRQNPESQNDLILDLELARWGRQNHTVIQGRCSHISAPYGFHVYQFCSLETRARRLFRYDARMTPKEISEQLEKIKSDIAARDADDHARLEERYPGCIWKPEDFDLVIDSEKLSTPEIATLILDEHKKWREKNKEKLVYTLELAA